MSEQEFIEEQIEALRQIKVRVSNFRKDIKDSKELNKVNTHIIQCIVELMGINNFTSTENIVIVNDTNEIDEIYYIK